jgi:hypothetical protein
LSTKFTNRFLSHDPSNISTATNPSSVRAGKIVYHFSRINTTFLRARILREEYPYSHDKLLLSFALSSRKIN